MKFSLRWEWAGRSVLTNGKLPKSYTCPLILTFCASPNSFHLRADCSLCNTTPKPLMTKIQCYAAVLIYSTCNQIKTSSCSSSYSWYYELVYLSVCVLVVFSGRALTVVLQKVIIITNKHILWFNFTVESLWGFERKFLHRLHSVSVQYNLRDLYRSEAEFVLFTVKTVKRDHSNAIF